MKSKLPKKLSAVVRVALADMKNIEATPGYEIYMGAWHRPEIEDDPTTVCSVCFAGSVMAGTLGVKRNESASPSRLLIGGRITQDDRLRLLALNSVRLGGVRKALDYIGVEAPENLLDKSVTPFSVDPKKWRSDMLRIVRKLEKHGL